MNLTAIQASLLDHLGVVVHEILTTGPDGLPVPLVQLWVEAPLLPEVSQWAESCQLLEGFEILQSEAPPF